MKKIFIIIVTVVLIGIVIPLIISFTQNNENISSEIKFEASLSIPKILRLITIYQSFSEEEDEKIVVGTHTIFNIKLQEIVFSDGIDGSIIINYLPFNNNQEIIVKEKEEGYKKFVSNEFGYSLEYPKDWWHNSVPAESLGNAPLSAVILLSIDEFGKGNYLDYKHSYSKYSDMFNFSISVYSVADKHTAEEAKAELGMNNSSNTTEKINNYNTIVRVRDDSNHEIEAVRMYIKYYYIQKGNYFYEISFVALNKIVLDQNNTTIDNILDSFDINELN